MPRNLEPMFAEETSKSSQAQLFHLIALQYPYIDDSDQGGVLYLVDSNYDVTFDGQLYARFPLKFNGASVNSDGTVDQASITIANVSREIMYYVEECDGLRNMRVKIKTVYANALDFVYTPHEDGTTTAVVNALANSNAFIEDEYVIDNYSANESVVTFQLYPIIDLEVKLPRRRYMIDSCYWTYKDPNTCKYKGDLPTCDKNLTACKLHIVSWPRVPEGTPLTMRQNDTAQMTIPWIFGDATPLTAGWSLILHGTDTYGILGIDIGELDLVTITLARPFTGATYTTTDYIIMTNYGNERNFGGFPGINGSRSVFL